MTVTIRVPCSSANIGPGFDVIGLALSIWLELRVEIIPSNSHVASYNCLITYEGQGAAEIPLEADQNLITQTALYVLRCHGQRAFPAGTRVHIKNSIPLGRGLGSSGAAVVAGVALGNEVGKLGLTKERMLDYCLMIERHPDNVAAALYGGFVGTYLNDLCPADFSRIEIPVSEVLSPPVGGVDTGIPPPVPAFNIGHYIKFNWAPELKAVTIIPDFEVATSEARRVLPSHYSRADVVFNMQRVALLPSALGQSPPDAEKIYSAMQDRIHQPYRTQLIPGLSQILQALEMTPKSFPGLCGICLSGAGPTILALATRNFETIANAIMDISQLNGIKCSWRLLEPAEEGTSVSYS